MALVSIDKIPCVQSGSNYIYELNTLLFNESIFKMCTDCGVFAHDFSDMFCGCGRKLDYVDVSDVEALKKWLNVLDLLNPDGDNMEDNMDDVGDEILLDDKMDLITETHTCTFDGGEECSNPDCIDCADCADCDWDFSSDADVDAVFHMFVNDKIACGPDCGPDCNCDWDNRSSDGEGEDVWDSV